MNKNNLVTVGSVYGSLEVIERIVGQKQNVRVRCSCGNIFDTYTYNLTNGATHRCKACANADRLGKPNLANRIDPSQRTINDLWNTFKKNLRNKEGSLLSKEEWFQIVQGRCTYCNRPPSNCKKALVAHAEDFWYNGVDRIDSSLPYTIDNVQPACWVCNRMRGNVSHEDFLSHIALIAEHSLTRR